MKVLFLDVDGVLNCEKTPHEGVLGIDKYMAFLVGKIVMNTGCDVVLSSSWKGHKEAEEEIRKRVVPFIDRTPDLGGFRGNEIKAYLDAHPRVTRYAILDDGHDFYPDQNLFKTTWLNGLTDEIANDVIQYFNLQK